MAVASATQPHPTSDEIIRRSVAATDADWQEAPNYSFINRVAESKHVAPRVLKTYDVLMIEGSPYNKVIAANDNPLAPGERAEEERKLQREIYKRQHESNRERSHRIVKYNRERGQDHAMMKQMVEAFDFTLSGEEHLAGREVWVLNATPKPGYVPHNHEGKVLMGMKGKLWIDQATYQWVKVEAQVARPVSFFGFFARVGPGTRFVLEQEPVNDNLWLPKHFSVNVVASAFGFIDESSTEDDTYRDYRPMPNAVALAPSARSTQWRINPGSRPC
jgi:hypothetical protein